MTPISPPGRGPGAPTNAQNTRETRSRNLAAVFEAIREADGISRTEIGTTMPFSLQTVTTIGQELLAMGLIREGDRLQASAKGKPHIALHIVPERGYAIGAQLRWNSVSLCLVDLGYNVVAQDYREISPFPVTRYEQDVIAFLGEFIDQHRDKDIWTLGVSAPLPVASRAMIEAFPRTIEWKDGEWFQAFWDAYSTTSLRDIFQRATGLPTIVLNNPQSAAIAEALSAPVNARMIYIMVGLSLGAAFVSRRELNQELWRHAGEIGYIVYKDKPLSGILSVSGLREYLGLTEPQGVYEARLEQALIDRRDELDIWFEGAAERMRLIINFLENTMRPDGIVVGGFLPPTYVTELMRRVAPLPDSVVLDEHDPARVLPRLVAARHSVESIPFGAAAMTLSNRANSRFADLVSQRRMS